MSFETRVNSAAHRLLTAINRSEEVKVATINNLLADSTINRSNLMDASGASNAQVNDANNELIILTRWLDVAGSDGVVEAEGRRAEIEMEERLNTYALGYSVLDSESDESIRHRVFRVVSMCMDVWEQVRKKETEREERIRAEENPQPRYSDPSRLVCSDHSAGGKPYWP